MSQLWGPALDAEIAYRQERARDAWSLGAGHWGDAARSASHVAEEIGHAAGRAGRALGRVARGAAQKNEDCKETARRRAEEIAEGIEGMRPREERGHRFA